VQEEAPKK